MYIIWIRVAEIYYIEHNRMKIKLRVAALITNNNKLLMVKHKKAGKSYWLLPGGGVKAGEGLKEALERECKEELNLEIKTDYLAFAVESIFKKKNHIIQIVFVSFSENYDSISIGKDRRVVDFGFFSSQDLEHLIIYPDIKNEIIHYLGGNKPSHTYIYRDWLI